MVIKVGVIGATGCAGAQLVETLQSHPEVNLVLYSAYNYADSHLDDISNNYAELIKDVCTSAEEAAAKLDQLDVLFISLPRSKAFEITNKALSLGIRVIDLGSDFTLKSEGVYEDRSQAEHERSSLLKEPVYGLTELNREHIKTCHLLTIPGCHSTATILALAPLLEHKLVDEGTIVIDSNSNAPGEDATVDFSQAPIHADGGILTTCYGKMKTNLSTNELVDIYKSFYKDDHFVKNINGLPELKLTGGSGLYHIGIKVDKCTKRVTIISTIDNLIKGAASKAVQNMNVMFGLKETIGLEVM